MYWEKEIETMPREKLEAIQFERLKATLKKAANSYHYGKVYKEKGFNPDDFKSTGRRAQSSSHDEGRSPGKLALRVSGRAERGTRAHALLVGHDRQGDGHLPHGE